jgi:hypothetical protein
MTPFMFARSFYSLCNPVILCLTYTFKLSWIKKIINMSLTYSWCILFGKTDSRVSFSSEGETAQLFHYLFFWLSASRLL